MKIEAYAAASAGEKIKPFTYEVGEIELDEVEIDVQYCGVCHSDLSMLKNDWGMTKYPFIGGHEVVGTVAKLGDAVKNLKIGQTVGLGWAAGSCMTCPQCMGGHHNLCPDAEATIIGRHGGFANKVRAHAGWVIPLPEGLDPAKVGPMFCGGVTVFSPIVINNVSALSKVGVVGVGGLGHLAVQFLNKWGCDVTAFSHSSGKEDEVLGFGAQHFVDTSRDGAIEELAGKFDFIISTVNVDLEWDKYIAALSPRGHLHLVGATESTKFTTMPLIMGEKTIGASPTGAPVTIERMLDFSARHGVAPKCEFYPMSEINEAFEHLEAGKARYRIVLEAGK